MLSCFVVHVRNSVCFRLRRRPPALRRPRPEQVGTFSLGFSYCLRTPENSRKSPQFHGKKEVFFSDACSFFCFGILFFVIHGFCCVSAYWYSRKGTSKIHIFFRADCRYPKIRPLSSRTTGVPYKSSRPFYLELLMISHD